MSTSTIEKPRKQSKPADEPAKAEPVAELVKVEPAKPDGGHIGLWCFYWQPQESGIQAFPAQLMELAKTGGWQVNVHYFGGRVRRASNSKFSDEPKSRMLTLALPEGYVGGVYGRQEPAPPAIEPAKAETTEPTLPTRTLGVLPAVSPSRQMSPGVGPRITE